MNTCATEEYAAVSLARSKSRLHQRFETVSSGDAATHITRIDIAITANERLSLQQLSSSPIFTQ